MKVENSRERTSSVMPMPVSLIATLTRQSPGLRPADDDRHLHIAALGELDGVRQQVAHALAHPHRIVVQHRSAGPARYRDRY